MKINLEEFRKRSEYINEQKHPTLDLIIWNYSQHCQFYGAWDEFTTMARGLITDLEGNIVARPFKKFFNLGQDPNQSLPTEDPIIYEKLDGSLGIQFYDNNLAPVIATRGSFNSDQAIWATKWLQQKFPVNIFLKDKTYLYEIIYPQNRIVIDYKNKSGLMLLAVVDIETGLEDPDLLRDEAARLNFKTAERIRYSDLNHLIESAKKLPGDQEGYVFHWPDHNNLRLKIKGDEYVRLHRLITGFSNKSIWELLANGQSMDEMLEKVPDEFYQWVKLVKQDLEHSFDYLNDVAGEAYLEVKDLPTRKDQALEIMKNHKDFSDLIFGLLDKKDISSMIWKRLKPKFAKPFKVDIDQ